MSDEITSDEITTTGVAPVAPEASREAPAEQPQAEPAV